MTRSGLRDIVLFFLIVTFMGDAALGRISNNDDARQGEGIGGSRGGRFFDLAGARGRKLGVDVQDHGINRVFIFGDSLSDTQNLLKKTGGMVPPAPLYWKGRFSNGPMWIEYLAESLGVSVHNFAEAGARAVGSNHFYILPKILEHFWVDEIETQLDGFRREGFLPRASDLFVIWIGGNDHLLFPGHHEIDDIIAQIERLIGALKDLGARKLMILNLPDVSISPFHELGIGSFLMSPVGIRRLVTEHNRALKMSVQRLRAANPDLELTEIDMHHIIEKLVKNARQYDFLETRFPCLGGPLMKAGQGSWNPIELMASISNGTCLNPDRYFFWDPWHPSTKVHCLAAANVLDQMDQAHLLQGLGDKIQLESMEKSCLKG